jgi:protein-S-isoprenylcysteine O-methyltransferase Ste14
MSLKRELSKQGNFLFRHRGILPLPMLLAGIVVFWLDMKGGKIPLDAYFNYQLICLSISAFGQIIRIITIGFVPRGTSGRNTDNQIADTLNTKGIYSIVRHPLYIGNFFMFFGISMLTMNFWFIAFFTVLYFLYYERIMYAEEEFLTIKFGDEFNSWAINTPLIIPSFKNWTSSDLDFSVRNVLKREYNGLFNMLLVFTVFDSVKNVIIKHRFFPDNFWVYAFVGGFFIFAVLRFLKHKTKVLDVEGR